MVWVAEQLRSARARVLLKLRQVLLALIPRKLIRTVQWETVLSIELIIRPPRKAHVFTIKYAVYKRLEFFLIKKKRFGRRGRECCCGNRWCGWLWLAVRSFVYLRASPVEKCHFILK